MTKELEERISFLESLEEGIVASDANVSNPPTDAELDTAFGNASDLSDGFMASIDDNGAGTTYWLVWVHGSSWLYIQAGIAV